MEEPAMIRKLVSTIVSVAIGVAVCAMVVPAQSGQMEGSVRVVTESGEKQPVQGAVLEIHRLDIKGKWETKTDKSGRFIYLGLPIVGTFLVIVSGPSISPTYLNNVRINLGEPVNIEVTPGDGRRLTFDEVQAAIKGQKAAPSTGGPGDKARAEAAAKSQKEQEAKKKEADALQASFDTAREHFNKGVELKNAKNFTGALSEFEQAAMIDPSKHAEFVQISHRAHANVAEVNYLLGVDLFNAKKKNESKAHFTTAIEAIKKAIAIAPTEKNAAAGATDMLVYYDIYAKVARLLVEYLYVTEFVDEAVGVINQAEAADALNKVKWSVMKADLYRAGGKYDEALAGYKAVLAGEPNNLDAIYGAGLTLLSSSEKEKLQEAANFLADFVAKASPSDQKWSQKVVDAKAALEVLKNESKVEAERPSRRRRP
jgi:tetratricopeptide (TPR) repeat protein